MEDIFQSTPSECSTDILFSNCVESQIGQRLGINYVRSQEEEINIKLGDSDTVICLQQSCLGMMAISSVVWDAGILLVDFLCSIYRDKLSTEVKYHNNDIILAQSTPKSTSASRFIPVEKLKQQWHRFNVNECLGDVLELGSGTGIGGLACGYLGANRVTFSDLSQSSLLKQNIDPLQISHPDRIIDFITYNWENSMTNVPENLIMPSASIPASTHQSSSSSNRLNGEHIPPLSSSSNNLSATSTSHSTKVWNTVICSDVLYDAKLHPYLSKLLQSIHFEKLFLAYKRRHDDAEKKFLQELSTWCHVTIVDNNSIQLVNLPVRALSGLFIIIAVPFIYSKNQSSPNSSDHKD